MVIDQLIIEGITLAANSTVLEDIFVPLYTNIQLSTNVLSGTASHFTVNITGLSQEDVSLPYNTTFTEASTSSIFHHHDIQTKNYILGWLAFNCSSSIWCSR